MARRDITGAVDFAYLEGFAAGDQAVVDEVLALFQHQAALWSPLLVASSAGWRDAAHSMKGSALGIGAHALGRACGEAEIAADALAEPALNRVKDQLDLALADIAAYQHEQALRSLRG